MTQIKIPFRAAEPEYLPYYSPEQNLWAAVLRMAYWDLWRKDAREYQRERIRRWVKSESLDVASFRWCCQHLGMEPGVMRAQFAVRPHDLDGRERLGRRVVEDDDEEA